VTSSVGAPTNIFEIVTQLAVYPVGSVTKSCLAIPDWQYKPCYSTELVVSVGYVSLSHLKVIPSGAVCFSKQTLLVVALRAQQKSLGLQSNSVSQ
jgi:hypothetical protein